MKNWFLIAGLLFAALAGAEERSPYAGEEGRAISSLSAAEIAALKAGKGMGLAKLAELNGYPGPRHVLDLAAELDLSDEQRARSAAIFREMHAAAVQLGEKIVAAEASLDRRFAEGTVGAAALEDALRSIGELRARLRFVHLRAHLEQAALLSDEQIDIYKRERGYG